MTFMYEDIKTLKNEVKSLKEEKSQLEIEILTLKDEMKKELVHGYNAATSNGTNTAAVEYHAPSAPSPNARKKSGP